ncbi:response regulator transcription factor (plasmid) [Streptomyces sp. BI20]|uniref:response regulator transcription factor n=1 Tax=Streptomyces sp. BI20 TaxID=3403460 RepID=UPI003C7829B3
MHPQQPDVPADAPRLLLVEDEVSLTAVLGRGLRAAGMRVDVAHTGDEGLQAALTGEYDALILDVMLPGPSGLRICSAVRAAGLRTPILMLTAMDGEYDEAEGLDRGADDYLSKPFSYLVLLARLRALLRRSGPAAERDVLRVGDLTLDLRERRCRRAGVEIALTDREFSLLDVLARNAGLTLAKDTLLREAWGIHQGGDPNLVEAHVSSLRRKLDQPFAETGGRLLRTVRGQGYRLAARDAG